MPYSRRTYSRRPYRRNYRRKAPLYKAMRSIAKQEMRIEDRKDHPLQWTDILFTGGDVNTSPTMHSFGNAIRNFINSTNSYDEWPKHQRNGSYNTAQANVYLTYIHYQLRFQQDVENIESSNTFRAYMYSHVDTYDENNVPISQGSDIDLPPNTEKIKSMYFDRMRTLRAGTFDQTAGVDEPEPTPGTALLKGKKKTNHKFTFMRDGTYTSWDSGDVRFEAQSDTIGSGLQLYGFIRLYFRIHD